jgi:hypothetical protein
MADKVSVGKPGDDKRVFLDAPGPNAKKVSVSEGMTVDHEIWEEVFANNTYTPSYLLRFRSGDVVPADFDDEADVANFRFNDYGPY